MRFKADAARLLFRIFGGVVALLDPHGQRDAAPSEPALDALPASVLPIRRKWMVSRVVLYPPPGPIEALYGPVTVCKIIYPGDSGPGIVKIRRLPVRPHQWATLGDDALRGIADGLSVEFEDLKRGVEELCGVR